MDKREAVQTALGFLRSNGLPDAQLVRMWGACTELVIMLPNISIQELSNGSKPEEDSSGSGSALG